MSSRRSVLPWASTSTIAGNAVTSSDFRARRTALNSIDGSIRRGLERGEIDATRRRDRARRAPNNQRRRARSRAPAPATTLHENPIAHSTRSRSKAAPASFLLRVPCPCRVACTDNRSRSGPRSIRETRLHRRAIRAAFAWCADQRARARRRRASPARRAANEFQDSRSETGPSDRARGAAMSSRRIGLRISTCSESCFTSSGMTVPKTRRHVFDARHS